MPRPRQEADLRVRSVLTEAIDLPSVLGTALEDSEARELLAASDALLPGDSRVRLRPGVVRRILATLPSAFNLYDRFARKVKTLAGRVEGDIEVCFTSVVTGYVAVDDPGQAVSESEYHDIFHAIERLDRGAGIRCPRPGAAPLGTRGVDHRGRDEEERGRRTSETAQNRRCQGIARASEARLLPCLPRMALIPGEICATIIYTSRRLASRHPAAHFLKRPPGRSVAPMQA